MKHLNTYEKPYFIIIKAKDMDTLFIMEVFKEYENFRGEKSIDTIQKYHYFNGILKKDDLTRNVMEMKIWEIIFKSNNIEDCIDEIKFVADQKKYNI